MNRCGICSIYAFPAVVALCVVQVGGMLYFGCAHPGALPDPGYQLALDVCREKGKDAGAYAVYEQCAHDADIKYGRDAGQ
jgi:hypothetical protein